MSLLFKPPWKNIKWYILNKNIEIENKESDNFLFEKELVDKLYLLKDKISTLNEEQWEYSKKITNPYELIFTSQGKYPSPSSVCLLHPLSRSYFKMNEIMKVSGAWDKMPRDIRTAHVCEGPGGFIQSIYENSDRMKKRIVSTTAMTLKPMHYQVPGWKRASTFLKKYSQINIHYGEDGTGDILKEKNQDSFISTTKRSIHIFTADGGIDFTMNYAAQEETIYPILIASTKIAVRCLLQGGIYVLKVFDCIAETTRDFLVALGSCFEKWCLYKPATSRPCNSEQYFIGVGFKPSTVLDILKVLNTEYKWPNGFLKKGQSDEFYNDFMCEQRKRLDDQIVSLEATFNNINLSDGNEVKKKWISNIQLCKAYCIEFHLPTVNPLPDGINISISDIN
jgi:23S rRNA U2552 (ribose-2'-O)-methylase RlmE/FtsJ